MYGSGKRIGDKVEETLADNFYHYCENDFSVIEIPLLRGDFYTMMKIGQKVSQNTIDGYWSWACDTGLVKIHDGKSFLDLDVLFKEARFSSGMGERPAGEKLDKPEEILMRTRSSRPYYEFLRIAHDLDEFTVEDITEACRSSGMDLSDESIGAMIERAKGETEIYSPAQGIFRTVQFN